MYHRKLQDSSINRVKTGIEQDGDEPEPRNGLRVADPWGKGPTVSDPNPICKCQLRDCRSMGLRNADLRASKGLKVLDPNPICKCQLRDWRSRVSKSHTFKSRSMSKYCFILSPSLFSPRIACCRRPCSHCLPPSLLKSGRRFQCCGLR